MLILGGTVFLGRHLVDAALSQGHEVVLFNRGRTDPELFPQVEKLRGDRDGDLDALGGRSFNVVIDTSGYIPRVVRDSARLLADASEHYVFVSSISVYEDFTHANIDESAATAELEDDVSEDVELYYGPLKLACEREVSNAFADRALIVRPGLIVGPFDPTDRFTYWVTRIATGGEVLAPEPPDAPAQVIDARDLADWIIALAEDKAIGVFNATSPPLRFAEILEACATVSGRGARVVWVASDFLLGKGVEPWSEMPLWAPDENMAGLMRVDVSRALRSGLDIRPLERTVRDTLVWARALERQIDRAGLSRALEAELIHEWAKSPR